MSPDKNNKQPAKPTAGNNEDDTLTPEELAAALTLKKQKHAAQARLNGAHSHGPVTPEGKAISSKNSLVHGHAAKVNVFIEHDDSAAYDTHLAGYHSSFRPTDYFESELVDELAAASLETLPPRRDLDHPIDFQLSIQEQNHGSPAAADNGPDVQARLLDSPCPPRETCLHRWRSLHYIDRCNFAASLCRLGSERWPWSQPARRQPSRSTLARALAWPKAFYVMLGSLIPIQHTPVQGPAG